jgi:hypothetical protein
MEQSATWEGDSLLITHEILRLLLNAKINYRIHAIPPLVSVRILMNPVHIHVPYFLKAYVNRLGRLAALKLE